MPKLPSSLPNPLRLGDRGRAVRILERNLKQQGHLEGPVDGRFDRRTKAAVKAFEGERGWTQDGVGGNRLWRHATGQAATPPPNPGAKDSFDFRTVSINVKNNPLMPQPAVVHDVRKAARQGGLIGWQEIGPDRYFQAIRNLGPQWGHYMPKHGKYRIPNPISWKKSVWDKQDEGFMRTHGGMAKVSPARYITWVKLKHKASGQEVVRINTHLISGAWSDRKPTTEWRREQWHTHMQELRDLVARFKKKGLAVVVGGDFNRDSYRVLGKQVRYDSGLHAKTHGQRTLDYVMHAPDRDIARRGARVERDFRSDHNALVVRYTLDAKKK